MVREYFNHSSLVDLYEVQQQYNRWYTRSNHHTQLAKFWVSTKILISQLFSFLQMLVYRWIQPNMYSMYSPRFFFSVLKSQEATGLSWSCHAFVPTIVEWHAFAWVLYSVGSPGLICRQSWIASRGHVHVYDSSSYILTSPVWHLASVFHTLYLVPGTCYKYMMLTSLMTSFSCFSVSGFRGYQSGR